MSIFDIISLLGGLAMFLYGMRLMGDSLKENSSGTLKIAMEHVTNNPVKAFFLGLLVTALIQSSTATIVITSGLVGAGILTLHQSLGIIIGANVGTTVTGQIIRLLDIDAGGTSWLRFLQPSTLAPLALILGMVLIMANRTRNSKSIGSIAIGFGILFSGLLNMTGAVKALTDSGIIEQLFSGLGENPVLGYLTGAGIAFVLQSSSATIGILQAFSQTGLLTWKAIYAVIVGIYLGDCVTTAIVCSIGAKAEAKRVGVVNILFNLSETVLVLAAVNVAHRLGLLDSLWNLTVDSGNIANTNTIFNLGCAICLFPMLTTYEKLSRKIIKDEPVEIRKYQDKLDALSPVFFDTPALALRSCYNILLTMLQAAWDNIDRSFSLFEKYDESVYQTICREESEIDLMTDHVSRYLVELLPHLQQEYHISILDQYYKVVSEFERIGDEAVHIAAASKDLAERGLTFSETARQELQVLILLTERMLDDADEAFRKRDIDAAYHIEPLEALADELIGAFKVNHLNRMGNGMCNIYADANFMNLLSSVKRIVSACSNIGEATVIRIRPELASTEHNYFEALREGDDVKYNEVYRTAKEEFVTMLPAASLGAVKMPKSGAAGSDLPGDTVQES